MAKFEVIRPWHGVSKGQIIEVDRIHPAFKPNVRPLGSLQVATPEAAVPRGDTDGEDESTEDEFSEENDESVEEGSDDGSPEEVPSRRRRRRNRKED